MIRSFLLGEWSRGLTLLFCSPFSHSTLEGYYVDDALQGQGVYTYEDGGVLQGTYVWLSLGPSRYGSQLIGRSFGLVETV